MALPPQSSGTNTGEPQAGEAFLREVDDAVRRSDVEGFFKRYAKPLIALVVLGLAAYGGYILWVNHKAEAAGVTAERFVKALDAAQSKNPKQLAEAKASFAAIEKEGGPGYRALSAMMAANMALSEGKTKEAAAAFGKVAADDSLPKPFRDLALIRQTTAEYESLKPQQVVDRLKPLAKKGEPYFGSAGELVALAYLDMKRDDLAGPLLAALAKDDDVPRTIRGRAGQMAGLLGIDTVPDDQEKAVQDQAKSDASNGDKQGRAQ